MFRMTPSAATQVRKAASDSGALEMGLRVAAKLERDGSISYGMGFDDAQEGETPALLMEGVSVLIAPPSRPLLDGTVLDFVEMEPGEFSFIFIPPQAAQAGGCGSAAATSGGGCGSGGCGSGGCGSARGAR